MNWISAIVIETAGRWIGHWIGRRSNLAYSSSCVPFRAGLGFSAFRHSDVVGGDETAVHFRVDVTIATIFGGSNY
jgi:hypothetical protein